VDRDRTSRTSGGPGGQAGGLDGLRPVGLPRWLGKLPTWTALLVLAGFALFGVVITLAAGQEPGTLLGVFVILGSIAAALGIRRGKVYLLFPAPALTFFVTAIVTGKVHDAKLGSSTAGLGAGFTQWVAGIFFPAVIATILVLLIGGGRWVLGRQLITAKSPLPAGGRPAQGKPRPAPNARRPAVDGVDDWADDNPFEDRALHTQIMPAPGQDRPATGNPRPARPPRDLRPDRTDRDPWGDPRLPADRSQPTSPRPRQNGQSQSRSQNGQPQPRNGTPRPSFNPAPAPAPAPQRSRRQPPGGWTQQ
jgi:hypothetical protein